eukprot:CAMPEP_0119005370 /NCGR_PEP_ID=MMETSP1176-20130426/1674_1 /TAXON_ID=265551 /ORGANISM="Synedropsis recta cf, Strain CCMP1620" /LENGTH=225 /DNA_ID=CAMNT_0006957159 /DNA_START=53 /DNA_END=730 /DNA_ORIENTATION=-
MMSRLIVLLPTVLAFAPVAFVPRSASSSSSCLSAILRVSPDEAQVPVPFLDTDTQKGFIECFVDSVAEVDGVEYTIGVPCDHSVALCYFHGDQLVPVELEDDLMDDVYPIVESIVAEEFGEELVLQRTPQTLTLVGELEEEDMEDEEDDDMDDEDADDGGEQVEVLLSFEHRDKEFNLVRLMDPVLLVGKEVEAGKRQLLSPEESDKVMPVLEKMFIDFHEEDEE